MIVNPNRLYDERIITGIANPQKQVGSDGIDLTVKSIKRISTLHDHDVAVISEEKSQIVYLSHHPVETEYVGLSKPGYRLSPGVYDVTFNEGCALPKNVAATIHLRSTLVRNAAFAHSGLYDNSYNTPNMGFVLHVSAPLVIEENARVAQIVAWGSDSGRAYNGTYQGQTGDSWKDHVNGDAK
jgi:deoxycytidine triphosphate deaminase